MYRKVRKLAAIMIYPGLFVFGVLYSALVALRPLPARFTWLEVVIGDAITDMGTSALIYRGTRDWRLALAPWICHALTGLPMILGQVLKHKLQEDGADAAIKLMEGK